jgi:hypothetical protein
MKQPAHCKYTPLEDHLRSLSPNQTILSFTFEKIERIMGSRLPESAYTRTTWWDNTVISTLSHKNAWLHAGFRVERIDLLGRLVRFIRTTP